MKNKKVKISGQKVFCFISFIFIMTCCFWYGGRTIYFYIDANKTTNIKKEKYLAKTIINNKKELKQISNNYYYYKDAKTNYLIYSNLLFRIIKVNKNNEITIISEKPITLLANGKNKSYTDSYITKWLNIKNEEYTGILQSNLNDISKYLIKNKTCIDNIIDINNITCSDIDKSNYITPLSLIDYMNTGGKDSFINNGYYTYLVNTNEDKIWYINDEGKLNSNDGTEIYGVKFTLTLNDDTTIKKGKGTKNSPYIIEDENKYFASYVKLNNDLWQVYQDDNNELKLSLANYLEENNNKIEYLYSNNTYFHNDTKNYTLAYYLNNNYLNKLSYKDIIINSNYYNNLYNEETKYDYKEIMKKTIDTKIANLSIGNVFLNDLDKYYTSTAKKKTTMYIVNKNFTVDESEVEEEKYIIPCITIKKDILKEGSGTQEDPFRME